MKIKIILFIAMLLTSAMTLVAQSNNDARVTESRISRPYHYIHIKGEMNVKIIQDEAPGITVEGNRYQVDNTVSILRNDTLLIYQTNTRKGDRKAFVTINVENITSLEVSGKTNVDCSGLIRTDFLTLRAYDGARIKVDVRALKVDSKTIGCSFIDVSGSAAKDVESADRCGGIDSHLLDVMDHKRNLDDTCYGC